MRPCQRPVVFLNVRTARRGEDDTTSVAAWATSAAPPREDELQPHVVRDQLPSVSYCLTSPPPWPEAVLLGFQHYLVMLGTTVIIPTALVPQMGGGNVTKISCAADEWLLALGDKLGMHNKVTLEWLLALGDKLGIVRVPGIGLVYTDLTSGVPANFSRFVTNLPAFHRVLVLSVTVPHVLPAERYLVGRVGPPGHRSYRCIVRYGYRDVHQDVDSFETELVDSLATFIKLNALFRCSDAGGEQRDSSYYERQNALTVIGSNPLRRHMGLGYDDSNSHDGGASSDSDRVNGIELTAAAPASAAVKKQVRFAVSPPRSPGVDESVLEELHELCEAREAGTAFILGHSHVKTKLGSSLLKRLAVSVGYNILRRNCRGPDVALRVPLASLLEVGMVCVL